MNLVGASRLVLYEVSWNPSVDLQAMARIWRDGQTRDVFIYRLVLSGTIEEKILQRQLTKTSLSQSIIDESESDLVNQFSQTDLKDLFSFQEGEKCQTRELLNNEGNSEQEIQTREEDPYDSDDSLCMFHNNLEESGEKDKKAAGHSADDKIGGKQFPKEKGWEFAESKDSIRDVLLRELFDRLNITIWMRQ